MFVLMLFLGATAVTFVVASVRHRSPVNAVPAALRGGLAAMFTTTGITHFVILRDDLVAMVPPALPAPGLLVTVTGILELAGAAALLITPLAAWAAGGLGLLLLAMFPANVYSASAGMTLAGDPVTPLWPRAGMQALYLAAAIAVSVRFRHQAIGPSGVTEVLLPLPRVPGPAGPASSGVVLVSRLRLRSVRQLPGFLAAALRLRQALRRSPGAVSLDLAMQPLRRTFWTWSVWVDEASMSRYTRSDRHLEVMRKYRPCIADSTFLTIPAAHAPHDWNEAMRRAWQADSSHRVGTGRIGERAVHVRGPQQ